MSTNGNNSNNTSTKTVDCIKLYVKENLNKAITAADGVQKVKEVNFSNAKTISQNNICSLQQVHSILNEYNGLKNCVSVNVATHTAAIKTNVASYSTVTDEIDTSLSETLDAITAFKAAMKEVNEMATKLQVAKDDSCNAEQVKALEKLGGGPAEDTDQDGHVDDDAPSDNGNVFDIKSKAIIAKAGEIFNKTDDLFEKGIKTAGILAHMNVASLVEMTEKLDADAIVYSENVDKNIKELEDQKQKAQETYVKHLETIGTAHIELNNSTIDHKALDKACTNFSDLSKEKCEKESFEQWMEELDKISKSIGGNFGGDLACNKEKGGEKFMKKEEGKGK